MSIVIIGQGVSLNKFRAVDVNKSQQYCKFEPFFFASEAEQVRFILFPRLCKTKISLLLVVKIIPMEHIVGVDDLPMQQDFCRDMSSPNKILYDILLIDQQNRQLEDVCDDNEEDRVADEFDESDEPDEASNMS